MEFVIALVLVLALLVAWFVLPGSLRAAPAERDAAVLPVTTAGQSI